MTRKVRDTIPDDVLQWEQSIGRDPTYHRVQDPLSCQNTWVHTSFLGYDYTQASYLNWTNKIKYEIHHQRERDDILRERNARRNAHLLGIINKLDYTYPWKGMKIQPRWKSEYLFQSHYLRNIPIRRELAETFSFVVKLERAHRYLGRVLRKTGLKTGLELTFFNQLQDPVPEGLEGDYTGLVWVTQFINSTDFLGYRLISHVGFRWDFRDYKEGGTRITGAPFVTVFAGIQE